MLDLVCSLVLLAFLASVGVSYLVRALSSNLVNNSRLDGYGGLLLSRGVMEATYVLFEPAVRILVALRVTPNMVTGFALAPALLASVAVAMGHFGLGALLAAVSAFCDLVDGILARRLQRESPAGGLFDAAVDRYGEFLLLAGLVIYFGGAPLVQVVGLGAILGSFMVSYVSAKAEGVGVAPPKGAMRRAERSVYIILGCAFAPPVALLLSPSPRGAMVPLGPEITVELAMLIVAVVANISAVRRLRRIAEDVRAKKQAA